MVVVKSWANSAAAVLPVWPSAASSADSHRPTRSPPLGPGSTGTPIRLLTDSGLIDLYQGERAAFGDPWLFRFLVDLGRLRPVTILRRIDAQEYDLIVTESDLVLSDDEGDLHIPHYIELFGGVVFLEPLRRFEGRLHKAVAATA